ncbi:GNAT family N-acetyltransferase [Paracoccus aminophilus]|uniref:GNAT family N-acetyltransferase n=1 Tax=Paracoccus aminophilus TaxID=34003 RepID=UPI0011DDCE17|nr:GNAT family N-acetyltransferase [Paracoccus aminophilus]
MSSSNRSKRLRDWQKLIALAETHPELEDLRGCITGWLDGGATRRGAALLIPPAARGGDHGRGQRLARAVAWMRKIRRDHLADLSNHQAAASIIARLCRYQSEGFVANRSIGKYPNCPIEYFCHWCLLTKSLERSGKLIDVKTVARYLGQSGEA